MISINQPKYYNVINLKGEIVETFRLKATALRYTNKNSTITNPLTIIRNEGVSKIKYEKK